MQRVAAERAVADDGHADDERRRHARLGLAQQLALPQVVQPRARADGDEQPAPERREGQRRRLDGRPVQEDEPRVEEPVDVHGALRERARVERQRARRAHRDEGLVAAAREAHAAAREGRLRLAQLQELERGAARGVDDAHARGPLARRGRHGAGVVGGVVVVVPVSMSPPRARAARRPARAARPRCTGAGRPPPRARAARRRPAAARRAAAACSAAARRLA